MGYYGNRELVYKARSLRKNMTKAEIILWSRLRSKKVSGFKFRRQQPIFDYIVDFYCNELKLIIEVDGEIHDQPDVTKSDSKRENTLKINGYKIIRLSNREVEIEIDSSINKIKTFITSILTYNQGTPMGTTNEK
jgi:very-short-patch-repair endonuclease